MKVYRFGENKITIKNQQEIESMKRGGKILGQVLAEIRNLVKPGITGLELDQFAEKRIRELGGKPGFLGYHGYTHTLCVNVNEQVVHSIPTNLPFIEGDLISIDCGVIYENLNTDAAISVIVGKGSELAQKMLETAEKSLQKVIKSIKPEQKVNQLGKIIQGEINAGGFKGIVKELCGHGIGEKLHEDPYVFNHFVNEESAPILPGMTLAIEPIFTAGTGKIKTLPDKWTIVSKDSTLAIQIEHTVLITENGAEILTLSPPKKLD